MEEKSCFLAAMRSAVPETVSGLVFDGEVLLDIFTQSPGEAKTLLAHFLERCAAQMETLPGLIQAQNWAEAYRTAHSIKGSARMLSGAELGNNAALLEKACVQADAGAIESAMPVLVESFTRFKKSAEEFILS